MAAASDLAPRAERPSAERLRVPGALLATFSLGFAEACLHVARRPVPLRFALRFAAVNVAPSAVWASVSARHVALASRVPEAALVLPGAWPPWMAPEAAARRVLALRSVRALRHIAGSYGLAWAAWRAWGAEAVGGPAEAVAPALGDERVLRVAPAGSALSRASRAKHGGHVVLAVAPRSRWQQSMAAVDWARLGLRCREALGGDRLVLLEVEIGDEASAQHAARTVDAARTRADMPGPLRVVGVVSSALAPPSARELLDVHFDPLSAVLKALADQCAAAGCTRAIIVPCDALSGEKAAPQPRGVRVRARDVANGLLFRYGIATAVEPLDSVESLRSRSEEAVVVLMSGKTGSALAAAKEVTDNGGVDERRVCVVVDETLVGKVETALSVALATADRDGELGESDADADNARLRAPQWVSVADVCDAALQAVRELLRGGADAAAVQAAIYEAYGPQWALDARPDRLSDIGKYI